MNHTQLEDWTKSRLATRKPEDAKCSEALSKLTIVIPSYDRQPFLLRQAVYWGYSKATVIIVDGSPNPINQSAKKIIDDLPNIKYHHEHSTFSSRLKLALQYVGTPYAMMHGDDEFYLKKGLKKAIETLETNQELVACIGQSLVFYVSHINSEIYYGDGYSHHHFHVMQDNVRDRLFFAMGNYNAGPAYAILRQHVMKRWGDMLTDCACIYAIEIQQAILTYIHGKLASVNELYWLRSKENFPVTNIPYSNRDLSFDDWYTFSQYSSERKAFVDDLSSELAQHHRMDIEEARIIIIDTIGEYLRFCLKNACCSPKTSIRNVARSAIKGIVQNILPAEAFLKIKTKYHTKYFRKISDKVRKYDFLDSETIKELRQIESLVSEFYKVMMNSA